MKKILLLSMLSMLCIGCSSSLTVDNTPVNSLEINRFLGDWYEVARFDHSFERGMEQTKAAYTLREDGKIDVTNTGVKSGKPQTSKGKAKLTDTPALLRVSFFGPFYSDYRILMIDSDYQYALIGSGSDDYLWILSRLPQLDKDVKTAILAEAEHRGYDVGKLIWVNQSALSD